MPRASSKPTIRERAKRKKYQQTQQAILREKYGIPKVKPRHKSVNPFPNLSVSNALPLSNAIPRNGMVRKTGASHPDAKLFPIQQPHKQGYMLLTGFDPLEMAGGKKPS